ncbi:glucose-6-phosphate isomerase [Lysinibacter cavernae]|uniref:Glucose-6-phosphate isomerase n=1 Tax=Lysinibacter cavernae TaxID=1640652 RepID=A0A7X5QZN2_9MICO|nr:glucose-6-phosphate isomerase [Lysinibacter cavernae]NIH52827.1 glucose-6-phosphate isomerase [Lysinibacter cavernae]
MSSTTGGDSPDESNVNVAGAENVISVGAAVAERISATVAKLVEDKVASRLAGSDHTLWGPAAEAEAIKRLGWLSSTLVSAPFVDQMAELRAEFLDEGITHVVLGGMGGSSLAPEVITATAGVELTVLDSTEPGQVLAALADRLDKTIVVISSKSGSTVETDSQRRAYETAFEAAGINPIDRIIVVTDPGSPLHESASAAGYRIFLADPAVGGRYSALTAFGLVPSALAGANIGDLLAQTERFQPLLSDDSPNNPGLLLGAALAAGAPAVDKVGLIDNGSTVVGLGNWIEQLIAESTGKQGTGVLPVVLDAESFEANHVLADVLPVRLVSQLGIPAVDEIQVAGSLGAQFILWEFATAVAGRILGIDPFDQPDVESAKSATRALLDNRPAPTAPNFVDQGIQVRGDQKLLQGVSTLSGALRSLLSTLTPQSYISLQAYVNRVAHPELAELRDAFATATHRPTTFGWGPRFLHSTGQYHKGGAPTGVFLQIRSIPDVDLSIPERPFTFGQLITAQADGDASVLESLGRPVLVLTMTDAVRGRETLLAALADAYRSA